MIAFLRGRVSAIRLDSAVLEVGGVGLQVMCAPNTLAKLRSGAETMLSTSMVVREDSLTLFGFLDEDEKQLFELVQTASGVGPKVAQAMLAVLDPDALRSAIRGEDVKTLTTVPGIGQKGAQRIILELRDRIGLVPASAPSSRSGVSTEWQQQVASALTGLGWSPKEAERAVAEIADAAAEMSPPDVARLLRLALQTLSKQ